jgi:hypothetical protein
VCVGRSLGRLLAPNDRELAWQSACVEPQPVFQCQLRPDAEAQTLMWVRPRRLWGVPV